METRSFPWRYQFAVKAERDFLKQRAKEHWLNYGGENNAFFPCQCEPKKLYHGHQEHEEQQGQYHTEGIGVIIVEHFSNFFGTE